MNQALLFLSLRHHRGSIGGMHTISDTVIFSVSVCCQSLEALIWPKQNIIPSSTERLADKSINSRRHVIILAITTTVHTQQKHLNATVNTYIETAVFLLPRSLLAQTLTSSSTATTSHVQLSATEIYRSFWYGTRIEDSHSSFLLIQL